MVVGGRDKRGRKEEKEGRGFGRLPSFFFPSFFVCFLKVFSTCDFGPTLVVFFVLWGFDYLYFRILEIFNCDFVWTLGEIRVRGDTSSSSGLNSYSFFIVIFSSLFYYMFVNKFRIIHSANDYFHIVQKLMDFNDCFSFIRFLYL